MATAPISIRLDRKILSLLAEGARKTTLKKQDLVRTTLRRHLPEVIERESAKPKRITNVEPLPRGALARAYRQQGKEWDRIEAAGHAAQKPPSFDD
jgi:hypothetical protein